MNNEELIKENRLLIEENKNLKKQLDNTENINIQHFNRLLKKNEEILSIWNLQLKPIVVMEFEKKPNCKFLHCFVKNKINLDKNDEENKL